MSTDGPLLDTNTLPLRLTTKEVCQIARFGPATLAARIKVGRMPASIDQARTKIFDRDAVLAALGIGRAAAPVEPVQGWEVDKEAIMAARKRQVRG
jgi:hypothetical protein